MCTVTLPVTLASTVLLAVLLSAAAMAHAPASATWAPDAPALAVTDLSRRAGNSAKSSHLTTVSREPIASISTTTAASGGTIAPNPVRSSGTLRFDLAEAGGAVHVCGRLVAQPADRSFAAGFHEVTLATCGFADVYVVRLQTATTAAARRPLAIR